MTLTSQFSNKDQEAGLPAEVSAITRLTDMASADGTGEIFLLRIKKPAAFEYSAGQYVDIAFGNLGPRSYSIANAPGEKEIEIHIKRTPGIASQYIASVLRTGDTVKLTGPFGDKVLGDGKEPLVLIAGGMGFTPLKAIAEAALRRDADAEIHFFWGTNKPEEKYLRAYFEDMAEQYDHFTFHDINGAPVGQAAADAFDDLFAHRIFVAGPPPMINATLPLLQAKGARDEALVYDKVAAVPAKPAGDNKDSAQDKRTGPR